MEEARKPDNELNRLAALHEYDILDTLPEQAFDDLTMIAARVCGAPIALVSLVAENRQWFKSRVGLDAEETDRGVAFCSHAILNPDRTLIVPDATKDPRFHDNPLVTGPPNVISYHGAPLVTSDGYALGTLCVIDNKPSILSPEQMHTLKALARQVMSQLELRQNCADLTHLAKELSRSSDAVSRQNEEIGRFYHTLAHELKTPLTAAREFISLMHDGLMGSVVPEQKQHLEIVIECLDQIKIYINDLMDLTRLETGKLGLAQRREELAPVVWRAIKSHEAVAGQRRIVLTVNIPDKLPAVYVDRMRLLQVMSNLIGNALKFTGSGGSVCLAVKEIDGYVRVEIVDSGIGIAPEHLEKIFDRLYQITEEDSVGHGGLGIGLSLCRQLVNQQGGEIGVTSVPGEGSCFYFTVPVWKAESPSHNGERLEEVNG